MVRSNFISISVFLILIAETIPLKIFGLPSPFEFSQIFYLISFFLLYNKNSFLSFLSSSIFRKLYSSYFLFLILQYIIGNYFKEEPGFNFPFFNAASSFIILYVFYQIHSWNQLIRCNNLLILVLLFANLFGILIFIFGEPFASIRMTLAAYTEGWVFYGKGDPIAALSPTVFIYAYPVIILPILSLTSYSITRNYRYLILMFFSLIIVTLNTERISFGATFLMLLILIYKLKIRVKLSTFFLGSLIFLVLFNFFSQDILSESSGYNRSFSSNNDIENRFFKMGTAIYTVFKSPLTGGTNKEYINTTIREFGFKPSSAHNTYINIARNSGVFGFILFLIFLRFLYRIIIWIQKQSNFAEKRFFYGYIYSFFAILMVGFFHNGGVFTREPWTWILIGFLVSFTNFKKFSTFKKSQYN